MHILLVNRWYPPHTGYGGVATYSSYLAHALVDLGHKVTVLAARWSPDVPARAVDQGVTVYRILAEYPSWPQRIPLAGRYVRPARQLWYSARVARAIKLLSERNSLDIVEFADVEAEGFVYLRQKCRLPVVIRCHAPFFVLRRYSDPQTLPYATEPTVSMERQSILRADRLTAPSADIARTVAADCRIAISRFTVVPNPLDVRRFAVGKRVSDHQIVTILHVGRLERLKGIDVLAAAIPAVLRVVPTARFVLAGSGDREQKRLETILQQQQLSDRVTLLGGVSPEEVLRLYGDAEVVVVPSLYESFSYTVAQGMAAGLPVIASATGGIPETLGDTGLLVPPGDAEHFTSAMIWLADDAELRRSLGRRAAKRAHEHFDAPTVARRMLEVYSECVRSRHT